MSPVTMTRDATIRARRMLGADGTRLGRCTDWITPPPVPYLTTVMGWRENRTGRGIPRRAPFFQQNAISTVNMVVKWSCLVKQKSSGIDADPHPSLTRPAAYCYNPETKRHFAQ